MITEERKREIAFVENLNKRKLKEYKLWRAEAKRGKQELMASYGMDDAAWATYILTVWNCTPRGTRDVAPLIIKHIDDKYGSPLVAYRFHWGRVTQICMMWHLRDRPDVQQKLLAYAPSTWFTNLLEEDHA